MEKTASEIAMVKKNVRLQEWERQIEEQKSSGLSVQEWCQQHSIKPKTYYYHLRKVREEFLRLGKAENSQEKKEPERAVVPILSAPSDRNIIIEKDGLHITLPENISAEVLIVTAHSFCHRKVNVFCQGQTAYFVKAHKQTDIPRRRCQSQI